MFALFVTAKLKPGHRAEFIEATMGDAIGSNNNEPGGLQFDVHADPSDENTVYLYEVYENKTPGRPHTVQPPTTPNGGKRFRLGLT